jgi:hypothetical protein
MTLRLSYAPLQTNYASDLFEGMNIEIPLDGGMARKRRDIHMPGHVVQCTWLLNPEEYPEFMGFFRTTLKNASQSFLLDLYTDIGVPTTHRCRTIVKLTPRAAQYERLRIDVDDYANDILKMNGRRPIPLAIHHSDVESMLKVIRMRAAEERVEEARNPKSRYN